MTEFNFNYNENLNGEEIAVDMTLKGDKAEYLPSIFEAFARFLSSAGFTYLTGEVTRVPFGYLILTDSAPVIIKEPGDQPPEPVNEVYAPEPASRFKVGDRVIHNDPDMVARGLGTVTEVIDEEYFHSSYWIKTDLEPHNTFNTNEDGDTYFFANEVSAFEGFRGGDKVRLIEQGKYSEAWDGEMVVTEQETPTRCLTARHPLSDVGGFSSSELTLA